MHDGIVPVVTGLGVVTSGLLIKNKLPVVGAGLVGFGLANVAMGAIAYNQEEIETHEMKWGIPVGKLKKKIKDQM